jgi:hypothetical protein
MEHVLVVGTPRPSQASIDKRMAEQIFGLSTQIEEQDAEDSTDFYATAFVEVRLCVDASISTKRCVEEVERWMRINVGSLSAGSIFKSFGTYSLQNI